jgi:hypothetical protein
MRPSTRPWCTLAFALAGPIACAGAPEQSGSVTATDESTGGDDSSTGTTTDEPDDSADDDETGKGGMGCCEPHTSPGCEEPDVRACTCTFDPVCCSDAWDESCVDTAMINCMPTCMPGGGGTAHGETGVSATAADSSTDDDGSTSDADDDDSSSGDDDDGTSTGEPEDEGPCCAVTPGEAGCTSDAIESCVCEFDEYCCNNSWDYLCVQEAASMCRAQCTDDCCEVHDEPGCLQNAITDCVCDFDEFCCNQEWDQQCIDEAMNDCRLAC